MSSHRVEFTVVIPLYNKAPHVERAIRSVLEQEYAAAEIIVIDDASTDGGLDVVRKFDQVRILSRSQPGPGGYAARNLGIRAASSEWIAFLDADDKWRLNHLSTLAEAISANRGKVGCAFTRPVFVTAGEEKPYPIAKALEATATRLDLAGVLAAWLNVRTSPIWTGAVAIRRADLLACGMFPAGAASRGGDKDVWLRVMASTNAVFVPKITTEFHQDTVNRVTKSLDHSVQPIICKTIRQLLGDADSVERRLLRRVNNMEVVHYARYAAGAGAPFNKDSLRALRGAALRSVASLLCYAMAGRALRLFKSARSDVAARTARVSLKAEPATSPAVHGVAADQALLSEHSRELVGARTDSGTGIDPRRSEREDTLLSDAA